MSEVKVEQAAETHSGSQTLKVVLFGMPDAGKTSLLGALAQAAQSQEKVLGGTLTDASGALAELRREVYEGRPERTPRELVAYPLTFQPHESLQGQGTQVPFTELTLFDCDGRVANEFLSKRKSLLSEEESELANALLAADTLLLVVDASAPSEVLKRDFGQFIQFLHLFQHSRSHRSEVSGLPVYLVLTKCDLVADHGDSPSKWMDRIENRKRKVKRFFREQMEHEEEETHHPFGQIDLHVWATAMKRPALANAPARPNEPYQVAELFRQVFQSATGFHEHRQEAQRKLHLTFAAVASVASFMVLLALAFLIFRAQPATTILETKIRNFQANYSKGSVERFYRLGETVPRLEEFQKDPAFPEISQPVRKWVNEELAELHAYRGYSQELTNQTIDPATISSVAKLEEQKEKLEGLEPPKEYAEHWQETLAVKMRQQRLEEVQTLEKAHAQLKSKLKKLVESGREVKKMIEDYKMLPTTKKLEEAKKILPKQDEVKDLAREIPDRKKDQDYSIQGTGVPWATLFRFPDIENLFNEWEAIKPVVSERLEL